MMLSLFLKEPMAMINKMSVSNYVQNYQLLCNGGLYKYLHNCILDYNITNYVYYYWNFHTVTGSKQP